ncbi:MAG: cohesin domain-containing protein [bacterium]|nr:cohesin domain-containing protein [bacterium]
MLNRTLYNFSFAAMLSLVFAFPAHAAVLRLSPAAGTFILGSTFDVSVMLNTEGVAANTVEAELHFPPEKLQIANPSLGKSIVQIWASPPTFSNQEGKIYFIGGIPTPGVNISEGVVQSFTFRVVAPGEAKISFGKNTSVLANDGLGTNILKQTSPALFRLLLPPARGPEVFSPTHPEQGKWYNDPNPTLKWTVIPSSQGFSYRLDHSPISSPDTAVRTGDAEVTFSDLESGSWYFHVREKAGGSWGGTSHYALNIDTQPPAAFGVDVSPSLRTTEPRPILRFFTTDARSGFDHIEVKMVPLSTGPGDSSFFFEASSPYQLSGLKPGRYEVVVRAYDKAGNFRDESVTLTLLSSRFQIFGPEGMDMFFVFVPWTILLPIVLGLTLFFAIVLVFLWVRHRHHLTHAFWEDVKNIGRDKYRSQGDDNRHD